MLIGCVVCVEGVTYYSCDVSDPNQVAEVAARLRTDVSGGPILSLRSQWGLAKKSPGRTDWPAHDPSKDFSPWSSFPRQPDDDAPPPRSITQGSPEGKRSLTRRPTSFFTRTRSTCLALTTCLESSCLIVSRFSFARCVGRRAVALTHRLRIV